MFAFNRLLLLPLLALGLCAAPLDPTVAQDIKPVAIVSIASVERNLADIAYLTRIVGMEDTGKTAMLFGNALTAGIDKTRPSGLFVVPAGKEFHAVAFLPVSDLKLLLQVHKEQVGEPKDVGGSILEIGTDQTAFVKEQNGWAFLAEKKEQLGSLPADPGQLLGDLPKSYNLAVRVLVQNIPAELKKLAIEQMKAGAAQAARPPPGQPNPNPPANPNQAQVEQMLQAYLGQVERLMNETDEVQVGLAVDAQGKTVAIDVAITAREGTDLAKQMAMQADAKTAFAGFQAAEAALSLNYSAVLPPSEVEQAKAAVRMQREQVLQQLDTPASPTAQMTPEQKEAFKKMLGQFFDLAEQAASSGKSDGGAVLVLGPQGLQFASGQFLPDGAAVEKILQDNLEALKKSAAENAVPLELTMNAGTHGEVKLHRGSLGVPASNPQARAMFGEKVEFVVGTGKTSAYVAIGKECEAFLKKVIDGSTAEPNKPVPPMQLTIATLPILRFAAAQGEEENPLLTGLIASLEQEGGDKVLVSGKAGPRDITYRIQIQEGIIRVVGDAVKMFTAQLGGDLQ